MRDKLKEQQAMEEGIEKDRVKYLAILPSQIGMFAIGKHKKDEEVQLALTESFVGFLLGDEKFMKPLHPFIAKIQAGCKIQFVESLPLEIKERAREEWGDYLDPDLRILRPDLDEDYVDFQILLYEAFSLWLLGMDSEESLKLPGFKKFIT